MKNKNYKNLSCCLLITLIFCSYSFAQETKKVEKTHKFILKDKEGKTETFEWKADENGEMPEEAKKKMEEIKAKLKEKGIDWSSEPGENHIIIEKKEKKLGEEGSKKRIKVFVDKDGKTEVIEKEFEGEIPEDLKKEFEKIDINDVEKLELIKGGDEKTMLWKDENGEDKEIKTRVFRFNSGEDGEGKEEFFKIEEGSETDVKVFSLDDGKKVKVIVKRVEMIKKENPKKVQVKKPNRLN